MIISVSRRCDIPRFYFDWFLERLEAGFVETANPFNPRQVRRVSLLPQDAEVLVCWTRDPRSILIHGETLEKRGFRYYVMTTLTDYPAILEPRGPEKDRVIAAMEGLAARIGPDRLIWRYDPVFFSSITGGEFHLRNFRSLSQALGGTVRRVIISLFDSYRGPERRLAALEKNCSLSRPLLTGGPGRLLPEFRDLLAALGRIAQEAGMTVQTCAEPEECIPPDIAPGACIDGNLIEALWGIKSGKKDKNQRPHCRCVPSVDIGAYGPCPAACVYCYARRDPPPSGSAPMGQSPGAPGRIPG
ncbi:MAG: DUF1848 domain-containing protein [Spirochaetaceae bacterium]|jgi:hypothetical protein|nr:DUF1848 domain-containing protein [Spirochaetaceae bacterium]